MILDDLIQFLKSRGEISVLVGNRIRPGVLVQGDGNEASIRLSSISSPSEHNLAGPVGFVGERIQLDVYSRGYGEATTLADKVRLAMYAFPGNYGDDYVSSVRLDNASDSTEKIDDGSDQYWHRRRQDWLISHTETVPA